MVTWLLFESKVAHFRHCRAAKPTALNTLEPSGLHGPYDSIKPFCLLTDVRQILGLRIHRLTQPYNSSLFSTMEDYREIRGLFFGRGQFYCEKESGGERCSKLEHVYSKPVKRMRL